MTIKFAKPFLIFLVLYIVVILTSFGVQASTKNEYISKLIIKKYFNATNETPISKPEIIFTSDLLAKRVPLETAISAYADALIICDTTEQFKYMFGSCTASKVVSSTSIVKLVSKTNPDVFVEFIGTRIGNTSLVILPEYYFLSLQHTALLDEYFYAKYSQPKQQTKVSSGGTIGVLANVDYSSLALLVGVIFMVVLPLFFLFYRREFITSLGDLYRKNYHLNLYIFILLSCPLPVVLFYILARFRHSSSDAFIGEVLKLVDTYQISTHLALRDIFVIGIVVYIFVLFITFVGVILNPLIVIIHEIKLKKIKVDFIHIYSASVYNWCVVVGLVTLFFFDSDFAKIVSISSLCFAALIRVFDSQSVKLSKLIVLLSLVGGIFYILNPPAPTEVIYKNIFNESPSILILPKSITPPETTLYKPFLVSQDNPIFINEYLVAHPSFSNITNKPIANFDATKSFYVVSDTPNALVSAIRKNTSLLTYLNAAKSNAVWQPQNFLVVTPSDIYTNTFQIQFKFDCLISQPNSTFSVKVIAPSAKNDHILSLFNFPGCKAGESGLYNFPFPASYLNSGTVLLTLVASNPHINYVHMRASLDFLINNFKQEMPVIFSDNDIYGSRLNTFVDSEVFVYMANSTVPLVIKNEPGLVDLSTVLNFEITNSNEPQVYEIWSPVTPAFLRL